MSHAATLDRHYEPQAITATEGLYPCSHRPSDDVRHFAMAILRQAARDIVDPDNAAGAACSIDWRGDALDWFASDADHPASFLWCCEVLEARPESIRQWVAGKGMQ